MMEWENKLYQILLKEQEAEAVVDDWVERNIQSDQMCIRDRLTSALRLRGFSSDIRGIALHRACRWG